jgi:hypothetical protein
LNPTRLRPWITRIGLVLAVAGILLFLRTYGVLTVPPGMDTLPEFPPGTVCVIEKWPGEVPIGAAVFVEVDDGSLLTRVAAVQDGEFRYGTTTRARGSRRCRANAWVGCRSRASAAWC